MEESIISFVITTLQEISAQYPDTAWISVVMGVVLSVCGVAAVVTMWLPVPSQTTGVYAVFYKWMHALAGHFSQNKGAVADGKSPAVQTAVKQVTGK